MKILVFGANGPTGREVVAQARERGDEVTEFVRAVDGDATDPAAVGRAVPGHDAVVSALGRRRSFSSAHLMERAMRAIAPAMQRAMSFRVNDVSGIAGLIQPNSRVDILLVVNANEKRQLAKLAMENVRVLAIGSVSQRAGDGRAVYASPRAEGGSRSHA